MSSHFLFQDREEAGHALADMLRDIPTRRSLVLGIPRGGVITAAAIARELHAELDVILSRKILAPGQPDLAIGAIAENGNCHFDPLSMPMHDLPYGFIMHQKRIHAMGIAKRQSLFRGNGGLPSVAGRTVLVVDDGAATGATLIAALDAVRLRSPHYLIAAVPVASPGSLGQIRRHCDELVYLAAPDEFQSISQFHAYFHEVKDLEAAAILHEFTAHAEPACWW